MKTNDEPSFFFFFFPGVYFFLSHLLVRRRALTARGATAAEVEWAMADMVFVFLCRGVCFTLLLWEEALCSWMCDGLKCYLGAVTSFREMRFAFLTHHQRKTITLQQKERFFFPRKLGVSTQSDKESTHRNAQKP